MLLSESIHSFIQLIQNVHTKNNDCDYDLCVLFAINELQKDIN